MSVILKDITPVDLRIYLSVLSLHQPFSKKEFHGAGSISETFKTGSKVQMQESTEK